MEADVHGTAPRLALGAGELVVAQLQPFVDVAHGGTGAAAAAPARAPGAYTRYLLGST